MAEMRQRLYAITLSGSTASVSTAKKQGTRVANLLPDRKSRAEPAPDSSSHIPQRRLRKLSSDAPGARGLAPSLLLPAEEVVERVTGTSVAVLPGGQASGSIPWLPPGRGHLCLIFRVGERFGTGRQGQRYLCGNAGGEFVVHADGVLLVVAPPSPNPPGHDTHRVVCRLVSV